MIRYRLRPSIYDLDWMGIVNNISYVRWLEDIRTRLLDVSSWTMQKLVHEDLAPVVVQVQVQYIMPARGSGVIEVRVTAGKIGYSRWELLFDFVQINPNTTADQTENLLVKATQSGCFVALSTLKPTRTPSDMVEFLRSWLSPDTNYVLDYA